MRKKERNDERTISKREREREREIKMLGHIEETWKKGRK